MPAGRPTKYNASIMPSQAESFAALGATDVQIAKFFNISVSTLNDWKLRYPEFSESLKAAKSEHDEQVEKSLLERAKGYSHDAVKIFCDKDGNVTEVPYIERYPPDPTSMIFWLKNRQPARWRDKQEVEHSGEFIAVIKDK